MWRGLRHKGPVLRSCDEDYDSCGEVFQSCDEDYDTCGKDFDHVVRRATHVREDSHSVGSIEIQVERISIA